MNSNLFSPVYSQNIISSEFISPRSLIPNSPIKIKTYVFPTTATSGNLEINYSPLINNNTENEENYKRQSVDEKMQILLEKSDQLEKSFKNLNINLTQKFEEENFIEEKNYRRFNEIEDKMKILCKNNEDTVKKLEERFDNFNTIKKMEIFNNNEHLPCTEEIINLKLLINTKEEEIQKLKDFFEKNNYQTLINEEEDSDRDKILEKIKNLEKIVLGNEEKIIELLKEKMEVDKSNNKGNIVNLG